MTERSASIDDLLGYDDGSGAVRGGGTASVAKALLVWVVATAAVAGAARLGGVAAPLPLIAVGVAALIALRLAVRGVAPPASARSPLGAYEPDAGTYQWPAPDAMRRAVLRWEQRLTWHADTPGTFSAQLQPALRELADERLRLRDGLTLAADPARARAVLGEPTWAVLTGEYRRGPDRQELSRAVARLAELAVDDVGGQPGG